MQLVRKHLHRRRLRAQVSWVLLRADLLDRQLALGKQMLNVEVLRLHVLQRTCSKPVAHRSCCAAVAPHPELQHNADLSQGGLHSKSFVSSCNDRVELRFAARLGDHRLASRPVNHTTPSDHDATAGGALSHVLLARPVRVNVHIDVLKISGTAAGKHKAKTPCPQQVPRQVPEVSQVDARRRPHALTQPPARVLDVKPRVGQVQQPAHG